MGVEQTREDATAQATEPEPEVTAAEYAVRYVEERHWEVLPGAWLEIEGGQVYCCCRGPECVAPGAHPLREDWADQTVSTPSAARRLWAEQPRAAVLLPTGRTFDTLEVPETAGFLALARLDRHEQQVGPVLSLPNGRMHFLAPPGAAGALEDQLRALGYGPNRLDLHGHGDGEYVPAPPTRVGTLGPVQWVRQPTPENRWLPEAGELVPVLAYACAR